MTRFPTSTCLKFKQQYPEHNTFLMDDRLTGLHLANEGPKLGHKEKYFSPLTRRRRMHLWRWLMCEDPTLPSGGALCTTNDHLLKRAGEFFWGEERYMLDVAARQGEWASNWGTRTRRGNQTLSRRVKPRLFLSLVTKCVL